MPLKDTYSYERRDGILNHRWTERHGDIRNVLEMDDHTDSVSFTICANVANWRMPEIRVTTSVRMTYADLTKLVERAQEILKERTE